MEVKKEEFMTQLTSDYIVAYGYSQQFKLTKAQAGHLIKATEEGAKIVKFDNLILSTNYSWISLFSSNICTMFICS